MNTTWWDQDNNTYFKSAYGLKARQWHQMPTTCHKIIQSCWSSYCCCLMINYDPKWLYKCFLSYFFDNVVPTKYQHKECVTRVATTGRNILQENLIFGYFSLVLMCNRTNPNPFIHAFHCGYVLEIQYVQSVQKQYMRFYLFHQMLCAVTLTKFSTQTTKVTLQKSNDPVLICLPLKCTAWRPSILGKSLCSPLEYSYNVHFAVARSVPLYFSLPRHLKADTVCLPLVSAQWSFWLLQMRGLPNSITRWINRRVHLWEASIIESVG